jgi:hypothetical protein
MKRFAFVLAAVPLLLAAGTVPASAASDARVRLVYLSPDSALGKVDFYIDGRRALSSAVYDTVSTYLSVTSGQHTFAALQAGSPASSTPVAQVQQSLDASSYYSVFVGGKVGSSTCPPSAVIFSDGFATPGAGKVDARFVHMAPEVPGVDVILNNGVNPPTVLFSNVSCFQGSAYSAFPTGSYPVALVPAGQSSPQLFTTSADVTTAGAVYTLVGAGGVNQPVSLVKILDAASAGSLPQGAAGTGEGGTAYGGALPLALIAGSLVACALLLLFVRRVPA